MGISDTGMAGEQLSIIVFSYRYCCGVDTWLSGTGSYGSCHRRFFKWTGGRTRYFGNRNTHNNPFSYYGMFSHNHTWRVDWKVLDITFSFFISTIIPRPFQGGELLFYFPVTLTLFHPLGDMKMSKSDFLSESCHFPSYSTFWHKVCFFIVVRLRQTPEGGAGITGQKKLK